MYPNHAAYASRTERVSAHRVHGVDQRLEADVTGQFLIHGLAVVVQMVTVGLVHLAAVATQDVNDGRAMRGVVGVPTAATTVTLWRATNNAGALRWGCTT